MLFSNFQIRDVVIPNRVCVSPMSQYAAVDGFSNDWHFAHLARFALGGAGLIFTEATAVSEDARRTPGDLGIWRDEQVEGLARIAAFVKQQGAVPGVQLAHAGRKASERRPWHGETPLDDEDIALRGEAPWEAVGPTDEPYGENWPTPRVLAADEISRIVDDFGAAAARVDEAGYDVIEVYAAHGFLLHQFYSPLTNTRDDGWGGDFDGRVRLSLEVARSIRANWPEAKPLFFRVSASDWLEGGWTIDDTADLARRLKAEGVDVIDCSSGGLGGPHPPIRFPLGPAFQADFAASVREAVDIATMAVGFIWEPEVANEVITSGKADLVALARELLNNPNWPLHAARQLGVDRDFSLWKPAFGWWLNKRERVMRKLGLRNDSD